MEADGPDDLTDDEREVVHHDNEVGDDNHMVAWEVVRIPPM